MAGDCEMVGVLILGIQSLDRAARAGKLSISPVCDSWIPVGAAKLSKSQVCVCRAPPWDAAEAGRTVTPLM